MEGKGSFVILLVIVAILTLTIAVLAGYLFIMGGSPKPDANAALAQMGKVPEPNQLNRKPIFTESPEIFNLKQDTNGKLGIMQLSAEVVYYKKVKGIKSTDELIDSSNSEIKEAITEYFLSKTYSEMSQEQGLQCAKEDLKNKINDLFKKKEAIGSNVVWDVTISKWNIQAQ